MFQFFHFLFLPFFLFQKIATFFFILTFYQTVFITWSHPWILYVKSWPKIMSIHPKRLTNQNNLTKIGILKFLEIFQHCHFFSTFNIFCAKNFSHFFHFGIFCRCFVDQRIHYLTKPLKSFALSNTLKIFAFKGGVFFLTLKWTFLTKKVWVVCNCRMTTKIGSFYRKLSGEN